MYMHICNHGEKKSDLNLWSTMEYFARQLANIPNYLQLCKVYVIRSNKSPSRNQVLMRKLNLLPLLFYCFKYSYNDIKSEQMLITRKCMATHTKHF